MTRGRLEVPARTARVSQEAAIFLKYWTRASTSCQASRPMGPVLYTPTAMVPVRLDDIARAVEDLALLLIEAARQLADLLVVKAVSHREVGDATFFYRALRLFLRVHGGGNNLHAFIIELRGPREGGKLLLAVGSPVAPVEEHHPPSAPELRRELKGSRHRPF